MNDDDTAETNGQAPQPAGSAPAKKRSFSFLETDETRLGDRDLRSPLIGRFLKDHIDRLEEEIAELRPYRDKYYDSYAKLEILQQRRGLTKFAAAISSVMLAVGGVGIGVAKDMWSVGSYGPLLALLSLALMIASFFLRVKEL